MRYWSAFLNRVVCGTEMCLRWAYGSVFAGGLLAGGLITLCGVLWSSRLGTGPLPALACWTLLGLGGGLGWCLRPTRLEAFCPRPDLISRLGLTLLVCGLLGLSWLIELPALQPVWMACGYAGTIWGVGLLSLALPALIVTRTAVWEGIAQTSEKSTTWWQGWAGGIAVAACALGLTGNSLVLALLLMAASVIRLGGALISAPVATFETGAPTSARLPWLAGTLGALAAGCGLAVTCDVLGTVFPATLYTACFWGIAVGVGMAWGLRAGEGSRPSILWPVLLTSLLSLVVATCAYEWFVYRLVTLFGNVSWVWLQQSVRALIVCLFVSPWVALAIRALNVGAVASRGTLLNGGLLAGALGLGLWTVPTVGWLPVAVSAGGGLLVLALWLTWSTGIRLASLRDRALLAGVASLLVMAAASGGYYQPKTAARLLFATNVFVQERLATPRTLLPFLDEARLISELHTPQGLYSAWRSSGSRLHLRRDGIPQGSLSLAPSRCPQHSAEVLPALLPLALHDRPGRVAILGFGSSIAWQTCLTSPVLEVECVDADNTQINWIRSLTQQSPGAPLWRDERTRWTVQTPLWWVRGKSAEPFDVVVVNPPQASLAGGAPYYQREFLTRAAGHLSPDGILCERFSFIDFDPQALVDVAATFRSVFKHVLAVEMGPGEMAWLGTNSELGLIRPGLLERIQTTHVRDQLAELNWDWSVLLTLPAYGDEEWQGLFAKRPGYVLTALNGRFAAVLPNQLLTWSAKQQAVQELLTSKTNRLLAWLGEDAEDPGVLQRLEEVQGQQELMNLYNDRFWAYRAQVKQVVSHRPLTLIQKAQYQAGEEGAGLNGEDKRRLRYFQQLGTALRTGDPVEILRLSQYEYPFDPLVSYFLHQEIAEIYRKHNRPDPTAELTHRLHTVYYSTSADRSLLNVLEALRLVLDHPESCSSDLERWDTLQALLGVLQSRWEARADISRGDAREVLRDVDASIVATERALQELDTLTLAAGYSAADWRARREVIERFLLRPLRIYHKQLQPHAARKANDAPAELDEGMIPSEDDLRLPISGL